jgi:hypothetical protein
MADAAEEDFDLYVVLGWFAPRNRCKGKRRCRARSGISFRVLHVPNLDVRRVLRYAKPAIVHAKHAMDLSVIPRIRYFSRRSAVRQSVAACTGFPVLA